MLGMTTCWSISNGWLHHAENLTTYSVVLYIHILCTAIYLEPKNVKCVQAALLDIKSFVSYPLLRSPQDLQDDSA